MLCQDCEQRLAFHIETTQTNHSLCDYDGGVVKLIHLAKIDGCRCVVSYLEKLLTTHMPTQDFEAVMPAPSSLWGRLRGRVDLAYHLASAVAAEKKIKFLRPPFATGWHRTKRSHSRISRNPHDLSKTAYPVSSLLLIDDVFTTGETLSDLRGILDIKRISYYTLAKAPSPQSERGLQIIPSNMQL